ncbi:MAG TPA: NAD(P)-binding domain-containing protein [Candidatus Binatia bacterium]|nr:NAD(P)-binding domain-containing protein [Candidatus Binatia bacterium]
MDGMHERGRFEAIVIGGGQSGLAAGYHLKRRGVDFVILEGGERIGEVWRSRWDSLLLFSPAQSDALPGMPFPAPRNTYPTGRQMADYLESYADRFELPVRTRTPVDAVRRAPGGEGYVVTTGEDRLEADQVVVATGAFQRPNVPEFAHELDPGIRQLHSSAYRSPSQLQEGPVLVVGASHSGADIAFEAARTHPTFLSGRGHGQLPFPIDSRRARMAWPLILFVASHVLTMRTPLGRKMALRVRGGGAPLLRIRRGDLQRAGVEWCEERTVGVRDGRPVLAGGRVLDVANVVWCTGFRRDFGWIEPPIAGDDGRPDQTRGVVASAPGLYVLGLPFLYGFTSMFVAGAGRDAGYVADRLAHRARKAGAAPGRSALASAE